MNDQGHRHRTFRPTPQDFQGDVEDIEAVKQTLAPSGREVAREIIFGIGAYPKF